MRHPPPLQVTIRHFLVWRAAVVSLMTAVMVATAAWLATVHHDAPMARDGMRIVVSLVALIGVGAAASLLRQPAVSLRWDSQRWHLGLAASVGNEPQAGRLRVAIDVGGWMLLRFDPESVGRNWRQASRACWIPVQRAGLESAWHALRCAVYSPPPESGDSPLDSAFSASTRPHPAE